jgi:NADPH:quinone reductase-like Zn-dependent oxidoreductase
VSDQFGIAAAPDGADAATVGAVGLAGTTALDCLTAVSLQPGQTVLICGATGGVGSIAIQYAAAAGARVIATARPGEAADFVRDLGAEHVVDRDKDLTAQVREVAPDGVHAALHLAGDLTELVALLAPDGRVASPLAWGPDQPPGVTPIIASPTPDTLDRLGADAAAGRVRVRINDSYDLADAPKALEHFVNGKLGKIGITVS